MGNKRKRIAVLVGQADESYQSRFISGMIERAFADDIDVCVFSMYRKYQGTAEREKGESNIFSLMNPSMFDGTVVLKDSIQTAGAADALEERLHNEFAGPVLFVENESRYYDSLYVDSYSSMKELVSHLIEVHGYKKLAFLSGKKWHCHSKRRLQSFRDAMAEHDIPVREDWLVDGDFWYNSGEQCADYLISLNDELPEAVVCANDAMAIGLCDALTERGVSVPEDMAVIGYDSTEEGQTSPKTITSAILPARECGIYAADYMKCSIEGKQLPKLNAEPQIVIGESCGCCETTIPVMAYRRDRWGTELSEEGFKSVNNMMTEDFLSQTSLMEYISTIYSYAYQIKGMESFHLCLCNQWRYLEGSGSEQAAASLHVKNDGYPDRMIYAIRYNSDRKDNKVSLTDIFDTKEMLPEMAADSEVPRAFFFTPVFADGECFGYAAVNYGMIPRSYDEVYRLWISAVARGFENIRRYCVIQALKAQLDNMRVNKFDMGNGAYESLNEEERADYKLVEQILDDNLLTYHFQPIVRTTDGRIYSYEALMRATTDKWISPLSIIKYAGMQGRLTDVERATLLNVLSIVDAKKSEFGEAKVFINSIPGVKLYEGDFDKVEELLANNADVAVVELTEEAELSDDDLEKMKEYFKRINVETAVDDYGTGYSNVSNLLRYMPNYVKIDRSLLSEIQNKPQKQHFVREIIEFCHDNNIMALAEGVETTEELQMVIHLGADLIQGFYTARPSAEIIPHIDDKIRNEIRTYYQERQDGSTKQIYIAGKTNRVSLSNLSKDGCTDIVVGEEGMVYKDIAIIGMPSVKTDIHMRVEAGYTGRITLENVYFSNVKNRPCIELSENCEVTLVLHGENVLHNSGIQVPVGSRLVLEGDGNLKIDLNAPEYYGIGNHLSAANGVIVFDQDGKITIHTSGKNGVCIGSGEGGSIEVNRGQYILNASGDMCVGIGAVSGGVKLEISDCLIEEEFNVTEGVFIGSLKGTAEVKMARSSCTCYGGGAVFAGIGTIWGANAGIYIKDSSAELSLRVDSSTCLGALHGDTEIDVRYAGIKLENAGNEGLAFGGIDNSSKISLLNTDTRVNVHNSVGKDTYAENEDIQIVNGRRKFLVNDEEIIRELVYRN